MKINLQPNTAVFPNSYKFQNESDVSLGMMLDSLFFRKMVLMLGRLSSYSNINNVYVGPCNI